MTQRSRPEIQADFFAPVSPDVLALRHFDKLSDRRLSDRKISDL